MVVPWLRQTLKEFSFRPGFRGLFCSSQGVPPSTRGYLYSLYLIYILLILFRFIQSTCCGVAISLRSYQMSENGMRTNVWDCMLRAQAVSFYAAMQCHSCPTQVAGRNRETQDRKIKSSKLQNGDMPTWMLPRTYYDFKKIIFDKHRISIRSMSLFPPPTTPPTKHDNHVPPESPIRIRFASIQPGEVKFCKTPFNIIDFVALLAAVVELFSLNLPVDPTLLRLCRLAKLFRKGGVVSGSSKHFGFEAAKWTQIGETFFGSEITHEFARSFIVFYSQ